MSEDAQNRIYRDFLLFAGLIGSGDELRLTALTGGVSSNIVLAEAGDRQFCIKRALAKLKVADDWQVSVERNAMEAAWLEVASEIAPGSAPRVLGHDAAGGFFVFEYFEPSAFPVWKDELRDGRADPEFAARTGATLARIHRATANRDDLREKFSRDDIFDSIRLEPYLRATAERHPDLADSLFALSRETASRHTALVHGDVSPKNILVGAGGPVFLDAECAWYGDPAFDLAFCLNHFLLKCLWVPAHAPKYLDCFAAFSEAYLVNSPDSDTENRAARLLPGLLIARADGRSPVEYLTDEAEKNRIREFSRRQILAEVENLADLRERWRIVAKSI